MNKKYLKKLRFLKPKYILIKNNKKNFSNFFIIINILYVCIFYVNY